MTQVYGLIKWACFWSGTLRLHAVAADEIFFPEDYDDFHPGALLIELLGTGLQLREKTSHCYRTPVDWIRGMYPIVSAGSKSIYLPPGRRTQLLNNCRITGNDIFYLVSPNCLASTSLG